MKFDGWIFYQGMDFDGFDLLKKPSMRDKPSELVALAGSTPGCMAVNTNGWLKAGVAVSASISEVTRCVRATVPYQVDSLYVSAYICRAFGSWREEKGE